MQKYTINKQTIPQPVHCLFIWSIYAHITMCRMQQRCSQVFDLESQLKSQVSYDGNERSSAACPLVCLEHSIAVSMEFKACTVLQIVVKITHGWWCVCIERGMRFSSSDLITAQKKKEKIVHKSQTSSPRQVSSSSLHLWCECDWERHCWGIVSFY